MHEPKVLVFAGSIRSGSYNARLAALAAKTLTLLDAEVTLISLADYPMPIYDADREAVQGPPEAAAKLKRLFTSHAGVFIASPEYNASVTPLLKNALDWVSRVRQAGEPPLSAFRNRVFALGAASDGTFGAMRSLMALRQILELGCGALVIPEQVSVREARDAFDARDDLKDERAARALRGTLEKLLERARGLT